MSLAVVENGVPVAGVVYAPVRDEMYDAVLGGGARLNGQPIAAADAAGPARAADPGAGAVHQELQAAGLDYTRGPVLPVARLPAGADRDRQARCHRRPARLAGLGSCRRCRDPGRMRHRLRGRLRGRHAVQQGRCAPRSACRLRPGFAKRRAVRGADQGLWLPRAATRPRTEARRESAEEDEPAKQLLHLVIGGELESIEGITFKDLSKVDLVGRLSQLRRGPGRLEAARRSRRSTTRRCAISWCTCTACSTPKTTSERGRRLPRRPSGSTGPASAASSAAC